MPINMKSLIILFAIVSLSLQSDVFFTPCVENANRQCSSSTNRTDFLLSMKKGGTNILSTSDYLYDFFLCEEYNYDCGYLPKSDSYVTIANGVSLDINATELANITTLSTTQNKILPYLGAHGDTAKCGMSLFPLQLTSAQSKQVLDGYISNLITKVTGYYNSDRNASTTMTWSSININIRTALLQKMKANKTMIRNSTFWNRIVANDWTGCSDELKSYYGQYGQQIDLHAAYLIDSVTQKCNKLQSVNFLVDQSGSIGSAGFQLALDFLKMYVNTTNDDLTKMSIHFFDSTFEQYITFGHDKPYFMTQIPLKPYRGLGTKTGIAMNATVDRILAANFKNGLPKIMVVMTDGGSYDSVVEAAQRARDNGIIPISVGIGVSVNDSQLLQIAQTASNYIKISSYAQLPKLVDFISNYFCKQILTIKLNQTYEGNFVRVPTSPSYFRVEKSPLTEGQYYELDIYFETDPTTHSQEIAQSQIDPFPDEFTQYTSAEYYDIFNQSLLVNSDVVRPSSIPNFYSSGAFVPMKIYFIEPSHLVNYVVKKDLNQDMNVSISYVAVRALSLGFNISLKVCTSLKCDQQRKYYSSILNKKTNPITIFTPKAEDLSIFIAIGVTLTILALLCVVFIVAFRHFKENEEKQKKGQKIDVHDNPTMQNIQQNLVPAHSHKQLSHKSKHSNESQHSNKGKHSHQQKHSYQQKHSHQEKHGHQVKHSHKDKNSHKDHHSDKGSQSS